MKLSYIINNLFYFYFVIILLRILLTWFPNIDWYSQPCKTIKLLTDWFLDLFKKFIPPIGMFDFSPMVAIIILQVIQQVVVRSLITAGL